MTKLDLGKARMDRRQALTGLLAISAAGALAACGNSAETAATAERAGDVLRYAKPTQFFSDAEMKTLTAIADTIIPTTDTPGAAEAGVPGVIQKLASEWGDDNYRQYWREGMARLNKTLSETSAFESMAAADREAVLSAYDAKTYNGEVEDGFYRDLKKTVATAYYMSEPGATQELAYEAVPGEWIGQAPISEYPKTWAT